MTWIKICGTTNLEDALMSVEAGADALGFVFYENSPRNVAPELVREIVKMLPDNVEKIGVVPEFSPRQFKDIADHCGLTGLQIHAPPSAIPVSNQATGLSVTLKRVYLSFSVADLIGDERRVSVDFSSFAKLPNREMLGQNVFDTIMLDSGTPQRPGGTGKPFDWEKAVPLVETMRKSVKVVVAGGLNPNNVAEAIRILNPWGVDVVSGVEASPGKKDPTKVRAFIAEVRKSEKST